MVTVQCDACGLSFTINSNSCKVQKINVKDEKLVVSYFVCPKCDTPFIYAIKDEYILWGEEEIKRLKQEYSEALCLGNSYAINNLYWDIENLRKKISDQFAMLMEKHKRFLHLNVYDGALIYSKKKIKR